MSKGGRRLARERKVARVRLVAEMTPPLIASADSKDAEHLGLLAILHYVFGGFHILISCVGIVHITIGLLMSTNSAMFGNNPPPSWVGTLLMVIGGVVILLGWAWGICVIYSGRCIARRQHRTFSIVIAALSCASFPFGTALGIFTLIVLLSDSVRRLYDSQRAAERLPTSISQ